MHARLSFPRSTLLLAFAVPALLFMTYVLASSRLFSARLRLSHLFGHFTPLRPFSPVTTPRPITSSAMTLAKYRDPPQAPPLFTATPASVAADTQRLISKSRKAIDDVVKQVTPETATFGNTLLPLAYDENELGLEYNMLGFYSAVSTDKALRDASTEAEKAFDDFSIESMMREDIFKLIDAALQKREALDAESVRLLQKEHKSYINYGLGIQAGPQRDRFKELKKQLSDISITFQKNLNEENGCLWFVPEELEGVPTDLTSTWEKGTGEHEGKLKMTFKYPDYLPVSKYGKHAETRKRVFIANENKLNQNVELFKQAIVLRDEAARLLGYPNHATLKIEDKMAKTPLAVDTFLNDLRTRLAPGGLRELEVLKKLKESELKSRGELDAYDGHYYLWDHKYYDTLMLQNDFQLDQEKIAQYFPLSTTVRGMLSIFEELFGLVFVELEGEDRDRLAPSGKGSDIVWHEDVQVFSVWDDEGEGSGFVGYLYLDMHPREGKYGHAANFNLSPGFEMRNGTRRYPATALVCNFSKPTAKKPSLLKHDEVVTLFHELGHGIHDLVSRTKYSRFHGTRTVRDFVEAPSQMLENWCWTPSQLRALSCHYSHLSQAYKDEWQKTANGASQPDKAIPADLIDSIVKTKHVNDALFNLRQLHFGTFDMKVHEPKSHEDTESMNYSEVYNQMRHDISKLDGPEALGEGYGWGNGEATFGHLIGGYDAGYYGYLSSQVYSTDMFMTVFAKDPMSPTEGRRYRHTVLEKGGSRDEMEILKEFLGREPSTESFYKELGIST